MEQLDPIVDPEPADNPIPEAFCSNCFHRLLLRNGQKDPKFVDLDPHVLYQCPHCGAVPGPEEPLAQKNIALTYTVKV